MSYPDIWFKVSFTCGGNHAADSTAGPEHSTIPKKINPDPNLSSGGFAFFGTARTAGGIWIQPPTPAFDSSENW